MRDLPGPAAAPTLVLLHGWTATADTSFGGCYAPLARLARVVAFDQRGHGDGIRSQRPFRLADCADDAVAIADALGVDRFVPVGYSMGGAVAQLVWRRHPRRVQGLVLCATAARFGDPAAMATRTAGFAGLAALARVTPRPAQRWFGDRFYLARKRGYWGPSAIDVAGRHDWRAVLEAGAAIGAFNSQRWLGDIDVPTAVVVPSDDHVIAPAHQRALAAAIPDAAVFDVAGDHLVVATAPDRFVAALGAALESVRARSS